MQRTAAAADQASSEKQPKKAEALAHSSLLKGITGTLELYPCLLGPTKVFLQEERAKLGVPYQADKKAGQAKAKN